jgi:methylated-DNA-[protein]-cysteine S-methyltransferase
VWEILRAIPYGTVTTYGAIAKQMSAKMGAQAVGGAVGHNPISIIIHCHRVVGADGRLTGYAGGIAVKRWLLEHEGVNLLQRTPTQPSPSGRGEFCPLPS